MIPAPVANAPTPSATPHPTRRRRRVRALPMLLLAAPLAALAACGGGSPTGPAAYPDLATVPPRPRLSYDVEQRRAVEGELVRDRANAARVAPEIDYELGRSPEPPPSTAAAAAPAEAGPSPTQAAVAEPRPSGGPGDSPEVEAYVAEAMARDEDEGELKDFMRRLERPAIPVAKAGEEEEDALPPRPPSIARALGMEAPPPPPAVEAPAVEPAAGPERPRSDALDRFGDQLGGVLGLDGAPAATVATAAPSAGEAAVASQTGEVRVAFAPGGSGLPAGAEVSLGRVLAQARRDGAGLRIAAGGGDVALRAGRAQAVAAALVRLGAEAGALELAGGGNGAEDGEVRVSLVRRS